MGRSADRSGTSAQAVVEDTDLRSRSSAGPPQDRIERRLSGQSGTVTVTIGPRDSFDSENVTVTLVAENTTLEASVTTRRDQDADGLADFRERGTRMFFASRSPAVNTSVTDPDTDDDGLLDGRELGDPVTLNRTVSVSVGGNSQPITFSGEFFVALSHPNYNDTDGDGLNDSTEVDGWSVNVARESPGGSIGGSVIQRWETNPNQIDETLHFRSNPRLRDYDGEGLNDSQEYELRTDPNATVTYGLTKDHETLIDRILNTPTGKVIQPVGLDSVVVNGNAVLTDASDDFVLDDTASGGVVDRFDFTALDGTERTDTWLSNVAELDNRTDPWDPDTDDDGLTDGQEIRWITELDTRGSNIGPSSPSRDVLFDRTISVAGLNATDPDSDGDGYWDGWIGVYNVSYDHGRGIDRADNVILYREHLQEGGVTREIVPEQKRVHTESEAPIAVGSDIRGSSAKEHSNVHLGELFWENPRRVQNADPTDGAVTPSPELSVEVDYYGNISVSKNELRTLLDDVEDNYGLYGLDISYTIDEEISQDDLDRNVSGTSDPAVIPPQTTEVDKLRAPNGVREIPNESDEPPFTPDEVEDIEDAFHDDTDKAFMFVATIGSSRTGRLRDFRGVDGVASTQGADTTAAIKQFNGFDWGIVIFTEDHQPSSRLIDMQKTVVHETGHLIGAGRNDDGSRYVILPKEIYSGSNMDGTPEEVGYNAEGSTKWSVMSSGINKTTKKPPMSGDYFAYSLEELLSIEFSRIDTTE